ncbi:hypothetical protein OSTOST_15302 [Ostertagia ostertagi]
MVMYRDQKHDSLSGDDDDDDAEATVVAQPGQNPTTKSATQPPIKLAAPPPNSTLKSAQTQPPATMKSCVTQPPASVAPKSAPPTKPPNALTATQQKQLQAGMDDDLMGAKTCRINRNFEQRPAAPVVNK